MPVKLLSESMDATITDEDQARIDTILSFWFREQELSAPSIMRSKRNLPMMLMPPVQED